MSYPELEFDTADEAGLPRLVFVLDEDADFGDPPTRVFDQEAGRRARQRAFRDRLREAGVAVGTVASPDQLELVLYQALLESRPAAAASGVRVSEAAASDTATVTGTPMRHYEIMIILDPSLEERAVQPSLDQFLRVVTDGGGKVDKVDLWGKHRLAYQIEKKSEGFYAVIDLTAEPSVVLELDRQLNLNEAVLRTKITRPEHHHCAVTRQSPV